MSGWHKAFALQKSICNGEGRGGKGHYYLNLINNSSYVAADKTHKTCVAYYALRCDYANADGAAKWSAKHVAFSSLFDDIESSSIKHRIRLEAPGGFEIEPSALPGGRPDPYPYPHLPNF